jgi:hypothetical protein
MLNDLNSRAASPLLLMKGFKIVHSTVIVEQGDLEPPVRSTLQEDTCRCRYDPGCL